LGGDCGELRKNSNKCFTIEEKQLQPCFSMKCSFTSSLQVDMLITQHLFAYMGLLIKANCSFTNVHLSIIKDFSNLKYIVFVKTGAGGAGKEF
jgi:hypothetical protein